MIFKHILIALLVQRQEAQQAKNRERKRKWSLKNPERCRESKRKWSLKNPERCLEASRKWRLKGREVIQTAARKRRLNHPEKFRTYARSYYARRYQTDSNYRLVVSLRNRLNLALRGRIKSDRTFKLLGCTLLELRAHLEKQFRPGMFWENYGPVWHADHVRPCASFDLSDPEQQKQCFHYSNLQPLFAEENLRKGAKY